jgi:GMP synthase (glutamine-hydrolysing)
MPKLLVCQHVPFEILGTLNPLFKGAGFRIRYVNFGRDPQAQPSLDGYGGLVILGGPMSVYDTAAHPHLDTEVRLVGDALERGVPLLGICLGAQLIARALGADVRPNADKEIGWYDVRVTGAGGTDPLFRHFRDSERIFQWHSDTFDLPRGAVHLAASPACRNQAFRYGTNVYGLQFHLEADEHLIERWLRVPVHRQEIESLNGKIDPEAIRHETPRRIERLKQLSRTTFGEFVRLLGLPARRRLHPSR